MIEDSISKSSGKLYLHNIQIFHDICLTSSNKQYFIKFYNEFGKVRLIRPLKIQE